MAQHHRLPHWGTVRHSPRRAIVFAIAALAYLHAALVGARSDDLTFETIGVKAGLPYAFVTEILQDHRGYVWIGMATGITRYDGFQFHNYDLAAADPSAQSIQRVTALFEDSEQTLWMATLKGLFRLDAQRDVWEPVAVHDKDTPAAARRSVWAIAESPPCRAPERGLWLGSSDGLKFIDGASGEVRTIRSEAKRDGGLMADAVYSLAFDAQCRLWVGSSAGLQYRAAKASDFVTFSRLTPSPGKRTLRVSSLLVDSTQTLWVGGVTETSAWDLSGGGDPQQAPQGFALAQEANQQIRHFVEDHRHRIWASSLEGLLLLQRERGVLRTYLPHARDARSLPSKQSFGLYESRDHVLWVGTYDAGLAFTDLGTSGFQRYRHDDDDAQSIVDDRVWFVAGEADGQALWLGTPGGLSRLDRRTGLAESYRHDAADAHSLQATEVKGVVVDADDRVWVATIAGLDEFERASRTFRHVVTSPSFASGNVLALDAHGDFWLGTQNALFRIDRQTGTLTREPLAAPRPDGTPTDVPVFALRPEGSSLWIGLETSVARLDLATHTLTHYRHVAGDAGTPHFVGALDLYRDKPGSLWLGTEGGLDHMQLQPDGTFRFRAYGKAEGLRGDSIGSTIHDRHGALWVSSTGGLSRCDLTAARCTGFSAREGLIEGSFTNNSAYAAPDGVLYFGGVGGLIEFAPDEVVSNTQAAEIAINSIDLLDRKQRDPTHIGSIGRTETAAHALVLPHTTAVVSFDLAALQFADPARNGLRFQLIGFDQAWRTREASQHLVSYTNFDPGDYEFRVEATSKQGVASPTLSLKLSVLPPFWATWWFRTATALLSFALVYTLYRRRIRGLQAQRAALELQVAQRTAELRENQARLEVVSQHKSDFLATMSHEIRTPMNAVTGLVHLSLREPGVSGKVRAYLGKIQLAAAALLRILDDVLDSSKIEAGRLEIEQVPFALDQVIAHTRTVTEQKAAEKGLRLTFDIAPECPRALLGDPLRLGQVLINLVNNAIKFTAHGEVSVQCEVARAQGEFVWLRWRVRDSGIGMTPEQVAELFRPFMQADRSISRKYGGTGLGLSISRRLVQLMGGEIGAQSAPGVGTAFEWTLRFARADADQIARAADGAEQSQRRYAVAHVLIVDDNEVNRLIASELLLGAGLRPDSAASGAEAIERVRASGPGHYAAVLMDLQMPGMDGYTAAAAMRQLAAGHTLPIVALTAHASAEVQRRCAEAGLQGCIAKPFHPAQLFAELDRFVAVAPAAGDAGAAHTPLLDPQRGLLYCNGNPTLYRTVLQSFAGKAAELSAELAHGDASDAASAERAAHTLRGLANTIGAEPLGQAAARLEQAWSCGGERALIAELRAEFDALLAATLAAVERRLAAENVAP